MPIDSGIQGVFDGEPKPVNIQSFLKSRITGLNLVAFTRIELEWLEERPVLNIVAILRSVVNAIEATAEGNPRCSLGQSSGSRSLKDRCIQVAETQCDTVAGEFSP